MKLLPSLVAALSAVLLASVPTHAEDAKPGGAGRGNPEERLKMMTEKLGLTEEQQTKIRAVYAKNGPELRELMSKGRDNLSDDDKKKVRELVKNQMEEVGAILTPEQREKMKAERAARGEAGPRRGQPEAAK